MTQLSSLIGKNVKLWDSATGATFEDGVVGVSVEGGASKLILASGMTADMEDVIEIFLGEAAAVEEEEAGTIEEESNDETEQDTNNGGGDNTQTSNDGDGTGDGTGTTDDPGNSGTETVTQQPVDTGDTIDPLTAEPINDDTLLEPGPQEGAG